MRICVWGASTVWGAGDKEYGGWVNRLRNYHYNEGNQSLAFYNMGISADTSKSLARRIKQEAKERKPKISLISIGNNDCQRIDDKPKVPIAEYEKNLAEIINKSGKTKIGFIGLTKVIESQMPWKEDKFYHNKDIVMYDKSMQRISSAKRIPYLKLYNILEDSDFIDAIHPNAQGHEKIFQKVKDFMIKNNLT